MPRTSMQNAGTGADATTINTSTRQDVIREITGILISHQVLFVWSITLLVDNIS